VFVIGGLIILQSLGIAISRILTAVGVGGLAVGLALQETLSNLFSGLYIMVSRQIRPGDYIKLNTGEDGHQLAEHADPGGPQQYCPKRQTRRRESDQLPPARCRRACDDSRHRQLRE
jgi:hypothetical protein